ncbi:MAG: transposase [Ferruginibacter sp.]|nr:transposase [Ferruginibacter sp.]
MDGKGRAIDSIFIERFGRSIKHEDIYLKAYENGLILYHGVSKYMQFYNTKRLYQSLKNKTPEALHYAAVAA